jgi:glycosyltransferase involved in cell wall biosynthesis
LPDGGNVLLMRLVCPLDQKLMSRKAHDKVMMTTCAAMAALGADVSVLHQGEVNSEDIARFYDIPELPTLRFIPRRLRYNVFGIEASIRSAYRQSCLRMARNLANEETGGTVVYLSELSMAQHFVRHRRRREHLTLVYEVHDLERLKENRKSRRRIDMEDLLFCSMQGLVVTTEALRECLMRSYRIPPGCRIQVAHLCPTHRALYAGIRERKSQNGKDLYYLGQVYPLQGLEVVIDSLVLAPGWRLHVVGDGAREYLEALREAARKAGVAGRIVWHGFKEPREVASLLAEADALMLSSMDRDRMPYVAHTKLYDYLAYGKPILAADLPSVREVLEHERDGLLFPPGDHVRLAALLNRLASEPTLGGRLGAGARDTLARFSCAERARKILDFLSGFSGESQ